MNRNKKVYYNSEYINKLHRKALFKGTISLDKINYDEQKQPKKIGGRYKKNIIYEDNHFDHFGHSNNFGNYRSKTKEYTFGSSEISLSEVQNDRVMLYEFLRGLYNILDDSGIYSLISRYMINNINNIDWYNLEKYIKHLQTLNLSIKNKSNPCECLNFKISPFYEDLDKEEKKILCVGSNKYEIESNDEIGAYDIIILVNQLHHAEPLELLQKYKDLLNEDGILLIDDICSDKNNKVYSLLHEFINKYISEKCPKVTEYICLEKVKTIADNIGFKILSEDESGDLYYLKLKC